MIRLTKKEKEIRSWLLRFATGEERKILKRGDGKIFLLNDYEVFQHLVGVSSYELPEMLQRISFYDFQHGQPLLECQLTDLTGGWFDVDCPRDGLAELLDELYGKSKLSIRERIARERAKVEWYWRVNKCIPERLIKSLDNEHIIVQQQDLARWTQEDLPGIAMQTAKGKIKIYIRYIVFDNGHPRFGYASYGNFYFLDDRLFIITRDQSLKHLSDPDAIDILSHAAFESPNAAHYDIDEDFIDEDTGDIVTVHQDAAIYSRNLFSDHELLIIPALFAGIQTNLRDSKTGETLYTGDAVSVKLEGQDDVLTAGLGVVPGTEHYGLILDNHGLLIPDEFGRKMKLYRAGSMFYNLDPYEQSLHLNGICCAYAQSRGPKDIKRLQIKSSPCIAKTDQEWRMAKTLNIMKDNTMTHKREELKRNNPWSKLQGIDELEAYQEKKEFVLEGDKEEIEKTFNKLRNNSIPKECQYNFHLPPMPFSGNLLDAKLIILTLNPGYVEYLNRDLVEMLAPQYQQEFIEAAKKHLRLEATAIYEHKVERIVGENYWFRKLQPLAAEVYGDSSESQDNIFRDVAIAQYIGYFSAKYYDCKLKLKGHQFISQVLKYLSEKEDVMFLVMRAKLKWIDIFGKDLYAKLKHANRLIDHVNSPLSQAITPNNLRYKDADKDGEKNINKDGFSLIANHLKRYKTID